MTEKKGRGRPQVADSVELSIGAERIRVSLTADGRVQVSMPGSWAVSNMAGSQGRKRIDVVPMNGSAASVKKAATAALAKNEKPAKAEKAAPKAKAPRKAKPKAPVVDITDAPVKRGPGRPRKNAATVVAPAKPATTTRTKKSAVTTEPTPRRRRARRGVEFSN